MSSPLGGLEASPQPDFPTAQTRGPAPALRQVLRQYATRLWWVTGVCLVIAIVLVVSVVGGRDHQITVSFQNGHGIKPGDALRYLGTDVGRVVAVELNPQLDRLEVEIAVDRRAAGLARKGSRFWIERPRLSLSRMSGLDTIVGAHYVGVIPGPAGAEPAAVFEGLETPPALAEAAPVEITIRFAAGHGLAAGDFLKHHGIVVGEVSTVELDRDLAGVVVKVRLVETAARLARAGSQFWIERPRISLSEVGGLETVVGGRYVAVLPGPQDAQVLTLFDGLDQPPAVRQRGEGGLEIVLESPDRNGLEAGAPVAYRGIEVGRVTSVGLASDGAQVETGAYIRPEYRQLVRENTRFWTISGIELSMGWRGVRMDMESLATVTAGGVAVATPDPPGKQVTTGHRFALDVKSEDEWRAWRPTIPIGNTLLPENLALPEPMRASLRWKERNLVRLARGRQLDAWVLLLADGRLLGPADLLSPVQGAVDDESLLSLAGHEFALVARRSRKFGRLALYDVESQALPLDSAWPVARIRAPEAPEDCVLVGDPQGASLPVSLGRLTAGKGSWQLDPSLSLDRGWHGASVVSRRDGALVGVLFVEQGGSVAVPLPTAALGR